MQQTTPTSASSEQRRRREHEEVLARQERHFAELRRRGEPAIIVTADGMRYWNLHGLPEDDVVPGAPDHPSRVGLRGLTSEDHAATKRYYAGRRGSASQGQHRRSPRAAGTRRRGSRRSSSSSRTSSPDPGEPDDGDPPGHPTPPAEGGTAEPLCLCGCGESLAGRKADCEFVDDTHSKRFRRREQRLAASRPSRQPIRLTPPKVDAGQIAAKVDAVAKKRRDAWNAGDCVVAEELTEELRDLYARRRREDLGYFCTCQSALPDLDEDGQPHCIVCGRPTDSSPPVNGSWTSFRDHRAEMETTADGQRYKRPQHRLLAKRRAEAESSPRVSA